MKHTIGKSDFHEAFRTWFSGQYFDNFSHEGREALFEFLTEYEESAEQEIELDIVAICCDFGEFETEAEALEYYERESIEQLRDETFVITTEKGSVIVQVF